jgi:hypothetical protein
MDHTMRMIVNNDHSFGRTDDSQAGSYQGIGYFALDYDADSLPPHQRVRVLFP